MSKQAIHNATVPSLVIEKLLLWAQAIRVQRTQQGLTADALAMRLGVSRSTIRRLELGEPAIAVHIYLSALLTVGLLDAACPALPSSLQQPLKIRVRKTNRSPDDF